MAPAERSADPDWDGESRDPRRSHRQASAKSPLDAWSRGLFCFQPRGGPMNPQKVTVPEILKRKRDGRKITMLTAYDYPFARILDEAGIDVLLVGDTLGMVVQG